MLFHDECSLSSHVVVDHEFNSIFDVESSPGPSLLSDIPGLSMVISAWLPEDVSTVMSVVVLEAFTSVASDIASSILPVNLTLRVASIVSDNNVSRSVGIGRDGPSSVAKPSDGLGSSVVGEMLASVIWIKVHNSDVLLVTISVLSNTGSETSVDLGSDGKSDTVTSWPFWSIDALSIDVPGLVETVVASPEDDVSSVVIVTSVNIKASNTSISDVSS